MTGGAERIRVEKGGKRGREGGKVTRKETRGRNGYMTEECEVGVGREEGDTD